MYYIYTDHHSHTYIHTRVCIFYTCSLRTKVEHKHGEKYADSRLGGSKITISGPRLRGLRFLYSLSALCEGNLSLSLSPLTVILDFRETAHIRPPVDFIFIITRAQIYKTYLLYIYYIVRQSAG